MNKKSDQESSSPHGWRIALKRGIVLLVGSDMLGRGEDKSLGKLLIKKFLHTIPGLTSKPETIIFINNGVKLVAEGSTVIGELKLLEADEITLLACGTCLQRFELIDKIKAGRVTDMYTIVDTIFSAEKVISI
jgi:selenium metabolism protein YedF